MDKSTIVNQDVVNQVVEALPDEEILYDVAELFKLYVRFLNQKCVFMI